MIAILVLAVEGYLGYRWYQRYYGDDATASSPTGGGPAALGPKEPGDGYVALVHRAAPENIVDNSTYVDHPAANGNPDAVLLVTRMWGPDGPSAESRPTGVWYDENRGGKWAVFNQDLTPMAEGVAFNVLVLAEPGENTFVHRATPANTSGGVSYVDHPSSVANPDAVLLITPVWNPGGGTGTYNDHPTGVRYDNAAQTWTILNEDLAAIPENAAFGVSVAQEPETP